MSVKVQKITEPVTLGEGPHWHDGQQALYFVSILDKSIHKYIPSTGVHTKTTLDGRVGFIVPVEGTTDQFLVGLERRFVVVRWDGREGSAAPIIKELASIDKDKPLNRLNDGKADPRGRVFAGTMGHETAPGVIDKAQGSLFRLDGEKLTKVVEGVGISNGLAWDLKEKAFYYIDSVERNIRRYDYDVNTGDISNMRHIFDLEKNGVTGLPDGMTIDTDGNLWVAVFTGSCILKVDPRTGKLLQKLRIPAEQVTSAAFGGTDLDILFVTTASITFDEEQKPPCGATFMITNLGVKGYSSVDFKL